MNDLFKCLAPILLAWFLFVFIHHHKAVEFYTDPATGCEYLISPNGTLVPRIDGDYMQSGCAHQEDR